MPPTRPLLLPFVPLYAAAVATKNALRDRGIPPQRRLSHPVVSVGSLSAGGAGKTPVVLLLADLLSRHGLAVRILTRGYGRASSATERVDPQGTAARFGDEPLLLAQALAPHTPAAVYVGTDRHAAGLLSEQQEEQESPPSNPIYLLDDGFQHRQLARTLDLVLLTQHDLDDTLLPAGNRREPLTALRRAHAVLLREEEAHLAATVTRLCRKTAKTPPEIWLLRRSLILPQPSEVPTSPLVFSGIARPASFSAMLTALDIHPIAEQRFPDHHPYTPADIARLLALAAQHHADGLLTTEKDLVKLTPDLRLQLASIGPLIAPQLRVELVDEPAALRTLLAAAKRRA
jgi:tetraacyldisaccharide 4'-kinase